MPFDSIVITKVFAAADEVTEVLRLDGPSGVLQEGGQSLTLEITGAAITAGALVLERARAGRGGYLPLAVFTANQALLRFFSRSRLSYDYRVRASEDFVGGATVTLSEVDDVQRELPKPDSRPYLILLDSGIQLPVGQNLVMYSPSEIIRDGLSYEGYGISNPQPATDGDCGSGSFLRFDDSGNLGGQVMTGAAFNINFCSGANLNVDVDGALMFVNAAGSVNVDSLGQFNYTGPATYFDIAASGAWQLSNGLAVMTASAAGDFDFSSPVATLHLDEATGAALSNPAGASIGFNTAGEANVTAAGAKWARLRNSLGAVEVQDDGTIQLLTPVAALGVQANGLISMSNGDSTLQLGTGSNGFYYIGDPSGTSWIFDITPLGAFGFDGDYGTAGYVPVSAGPGGAVTWVDPNTLVTATVTSPLTDPADASTDGTDYIHWGYLSGPFSQNRRVVSFLGERNIYGLTDYPYFGLEQLANGGTATQYLDITAQANNGAGMSAFLGGGVDAEYGSGGAGGALWQVYNAQTAERVSMGVGGLSGLGGTKGLWINKETDVSGTRPMLWLSKNGSNLFRVNRDETNSKTEWHLAEFNEHTGVATATLTNAPVAGDPAVWIRVVYNGNTYCLPLFST